MKLVHRILLKLIGLLMVIGGAVVAAMWWDIGLRAMLLSQFKLHIWTQYGFAFGLLAVLVGLIALLPSSRKRTHNVISFPGVHGDVTIALDSVESTLTRMVSKMPEVKKIKIRVVPAEDRRRVRVKADVLVYKGASPSSAREIANRITDYLTDTAVNMLGVEDVTTVDLNVRGIVVDARPVPPPKADDHAQKSEEAAIDAPQPAIEEVSPTVTAAEPAAEAPVEASVREVVEPASAIDAPIPAAEPEPVPGACESEGAWDVGEPRDTPAHTTGSIEDEVAVEAEPIAATMEAAPVAQAAETPMAASDVVLPPLFAEDALVPPRDLNDTVTPDAPEAEPPIEMGPIDGETKDDSPQPANEWKPLGGFRAWDDTDRSIKRLEE